MPTSFPGAGDAFVRPAAAEVQGLSSPTHSVHHDNAYDAIEAVEAKLGTGASAPAANTVLRGTGAGASAFGQVETADILAGAVSQIGTASPTPSQTTTSTTGVTVAGSTVNLTTTGGPVLMMATVSIGNNTAGTLGVVYLAIDGVFVGSASLTSSISVSAWSTVTLVRAQALAAGAHAFTLMWYTTSGTLALNDGMFSVIELKR